MRCEEVNWLLCAKFRLVSTMEASTSTPLFVTVRRSLRRTHWRRRRAQGIVARNRSRAAWIDGPGDIDGTALPNIADDGAGFRQSGAGKNSLDAIFHADGQLAEGPIALAEVQGYVYAAKLLAANGLRDDLVGSAGPSISKTRPSNSQCDLRSFFWCPEIDTYAAALDGAKRPCRVRTSNAGQLLFTGIVKPEHAAKIARGLLGPEFFSGWGIRTVSSAEQRYNPMSYHNGSIWPHDNALIALGFARYGHKRAIEPSVQRFVRSCDLYGSAPTSRTVLRLSAPARTRPDALPCCLFTASLGERGAAALMLQASLGLEFDPARTRSAFGIRACRDSSIGFY